MLHVVLRAGCGGLSVINNYKHIDFLVAIMKLRKKGQLSSNNIRKEPPRKLNPFEVHTNRSKYQVLGRDLKSDHGLPGVSKNKALIKRKKTLLQEYKIRHKNNQFIDQRIGERNKSMTEDDRIMARYTAEAMRVFSKRAMFNLSDTEVLTHKGQTLSEIERFEDIRSDDEEDDERRRSSGALKGKFVENAHFGGGMLKKSEKNRDSLIDELINQSKKRKAERQRNKEDTLEATEQLDEEWKTLGTIVTSNKDTGDVSNHKKDQYDILMRGLKFEPHGQPSQRLKTEEEIAKEDREHLEMLEKERLKQLRMISIDKYGSHKSADDLEDWYSKCSKELTEEDLVESGSEAESENDAESRGETESGSEAESDEKETNEEEGNVDKEENIETEVKSLRRADNKKESAKSSLVSENMNLEEDDEILLPVKNNSVNNISYLDNECAINSSSDDECAMEDYSDLMPSESHLSNQETINMSNTEINSEQESFEDKRGDESDLPFVLNIPDNHKSFMDLFLWKSNEDQDIIFERLIKSNHPYLEAGNKSKMLKLAEYIFECAIHLNLKWITMPVLVSQFIDLKEHNKEQCLKMVVDFLSDKMEEFVTDDSQFDQAKFLTWYILVFLRTQGMEVLIPINKPALGLACSLVTRTNHTIIGLLCCYLLLQDAKISSVVYPEAINYLHNCIKSTTDSKNKAIKKKQKNSQSCVNTKGEEAAEDFRLRVKLDLSLLKSKVTNNTINGQRFNCQTLYCSVMLLTGFVEIYQVKPQFQAIFSKAQRLVSNIQVEEYANTLRDKIIGLRNCLDSCIPLNSLARSTKKPKALRQYEPSYHTVFVGKSHRGLPVEQQEEQKLLHKYKYEKKGAMRELRRDREFLANVRLKEKAISDEQRLKKVKEIIGSAAAQQGELRSLKRKK